MGFCLGDYLRPLARYVVIKKDCVYIMVAGIAFSLSHGKTIADCVNMRIERTQCNEQLLRYLRV